MNKRENPRKSNAGRASDSNQRSNSPSSYGKSYGNKPERKSSYGNERGGNEGSSSGGFRKDNERGGRSSGAGGGKRINFQERDKRSDSRRDDNRAGGFGNSRPDNRGEGRSSSGGSFGNRDNRSFDGDKRPARNFGDRPNPRRDDNRSGDFRKPDDNRGGERSYGKSYGNSDSRGGGDRKYDNNRSGSGFGKRDGDSRAGGDERKSYSRPAGGGFVRRDGDSRSGGDERRSEGRPAGGGFGRRDGDSRSGGDERRSGSRPYSGGGFAKRDGDSRDSRSGGDERRSDSRPAGGGFGRRDNDDRSTSRERSTGDNTRGRFEKRDSEGRSGGERSNYSSERRSSDSRSGEGGSSFNRRDNDDRRDSRRDSKPSFGTKRSYGKPDNKPGKRSSFGGFAGKGRAVPPDYELRDLKKHSDTDVIRLNKYISNAGICSRREADKHIEHGMISVNGKVVTELGYKVQRGDTVKMGSKLLKPEPNVYVLLNKPKDFITTTEDPQERKTVMTLVANACQERIYPVGRLDRNTTGLLLFTNDGELAEKLAHPSNSMKKIYQVTLDRPLSKEDFEKIAKGLRLEDGVAKVDDLAFVSDDKTVIGIEIHSGRNRIVRRIFEHVGYKVMYLDRVMYAGLTKKDLPRGTWRYLDEKEVVQLKHMKN